MTNVTEILLQIESGDPSVAEQLLPLVYNELRNLAAARLAHEKPGQTLQATALVHEVYLRLVKAEEAKCWKSRGHFFGAAAEAMRRILVEQARRRKTKKAGGDLQRISLSVAEPVAKGREIDLVALDEALERFEAIKPRKAKLVKLRFFAGLTNRQAAELLGIATSTADDDWAYAKTWLRTELSPDN